MRLFLYEGFFQGVSYSLDPKLAISSKFGVLNCAWIPTKPWHPPVVKIDYPFFPSLFLSLPKRLVL